MRIAILADIHGNLAALQRVIAHARQQQVDAWWFLGDLIGYGPQPLECLMALNELAIAPGAWLMGNHDIVACQLNPLGGSYQVERVNERQWQVRLDGQWHSLLPGEKEREIAIWHALQLQTGLAQEQIDQFKALPNWSVWQDQIVLAHGCIKGDPNDPQNFKGDSSYIDVVNILRAENSLKKVAELQKLSIKSLRLLVVGHTHQQMLCSARLTSSGSQWEWQQPLHAPCKNQQPDEKVEFTLNENDRWAVLNPGSVGQPRDGDWRASYSILDTDKWRISFYRVEYPVQVTQAAMIPFYPEFHRIRLTQGK